MTPADAAVAAVAALGREGFAAEDVLVLRGERDATRIDSLGNVGGVWARARRLLSFTLADQVVDLAAAGSARLESIFLDEGFGTLDEANLDVVAGTLENLATRGDRMVGVVTHVPALAERVPVRFVVSRDQRTSSVTREAL